MLAKLQKYRLS